MDVGVQGTKRNIPQWAGYDIVNTTPHHVKTNAYHERVYSNMAVRYTVARFSRNSSAKKRKQSNLKQRNGTHKTLCRTNS